MEIETKKIQPVITARTYQSIRMIAALERSTMNAVIERSVREYVDKNYPNGIHM